ncbi:MAG: DUF3078 domain-containing protein [Bacteroidales bacterium]
MYKKGWFLKGLFLITLLIACFSSSTAASFSVKSEVEQPPKMLHEPQISEEARVILADSLRFHPMYDSLAIANNLVPSETYTSVYLLPLTFYGKVAPVNFKVKKQKPEKKWINYSYSNTIDWLTKEIFIDSLRENALSKYMATHPFEIQYDWFNLPNAPKKEKLTYVIDREVFKVSGPEITASALQVGLPKADRWRKKMTSAIQFSQNYVSENWYQGGESNINILSLQSFEIKKFDETKRTEFEMRMDLKTGFYTTPSDTMRAFRVNDNLLQLTSKYGIRAFEKWYYTASLLFKTQVFNNYKANTNELLAQFLSPGELNLSVGMDYKYENKRKNFVWSLLIAPLAYNLKYVANIKEIDETRFGIDEGKHALNQVGSSITNGFEWKISRNIQWNSRLFLFSNYHKSQGDFENVFNFSINRFFSTRISLHLRYDDDTKDEQELFQFKELLSFGFNYVW